MKTIKKLHKRGLALFVCGVMLMPYMYTAIDAVDVNAMETSFVETKGAEYGNERVAANDYNYIPLEMTSGNENLVVGGGTYDDYLASGATSATVQRTAATAINGIWSNEAWTDSPASIVKDGDNSYIKLSYVAGSGTFSHFIQEFTNTGASTYLIEFDYYVGGSTTNCQLVLNDSSFSNESSVGIIGTGTAIDGKDGWYRFSAEVEASNEDVKYLRVWFRTGTTSTANYLLVDNVSIKEMLSSGAYVVPSTVPEKPSNIWSYVSDTAATITKEDDNAVVKMFGKNYSSFFYGYQFEKAGVYAYSFDFKLEGECNNIGFRINPVNDTYTFDVPLLQYTGEWQESDLGEDWYHFVFYIKIDDIVAYKDGSFQFWCQSKNIATFTIDNLSVKRLVSATVDGNPVWGSERIYDGGFEKLLGDETSFTVPNVLNEENIAVTSIWTNEEDNAAKIVVKDDRYVASLTGETGYSSISNRVSLQNEGTYRVQIRYAVTENYETQTGAALTYALGDNTPIDILANAQAEEDGYKLFTQYVTLTAEEADAIEDVTVRFACIDGYEAKIDSVSIQKVIGSDIPKEEAPEDDGDLTGKVRYDIISGGDFENYENGTQFADEVTPELWGTISLDMPATVVTNDKDSVNTSKVVLLQHQDGSTKDFSSVFNIYTGKTELERGRTYYVSFDYKYNIEESLDTELKVDDGRLFTMDKGFKFCFVGGTDIGHHEIWLGSVEDGDMTIGANSQKVEVSKTDLGEGWARIQFSFTSNTGLTIACNSMRFLLLTNENPNNYAMIDNVELYTYYDSNEELPEQPENPGITDSTEGGNSGASGENGGNAGGKNGCSASGFGGTAIVAMAIALPAFLALGKKERRKK